MRGESLRAGAASLPLSAAPANMEDVMRKLWQVEIVEATPWQSASFTGEKVVLELTPPDGVILAELTLRDGKLTALLIDE